MRLGLIARADNRGLGQQTWAFYRNMQPAKTMVIDCPSQKPLPLHLDRYPDATVVRGWPTDRDFRNWLPDLDVVYTAETGYSKALWPEAQRAGVKTVLHTNYEFLNRADRPSLWAAPSMWHFNDLPRPRQFLPVPIELDRFTPNTSDEATRFLHMIGRPAIHDRNGTEDLIAALRFIKSPITLTIRCQELGYVENLIRCHDVPSHVGLNIQSGDMDDNVVLYRGQDVLIMPRRFGGLCLPVNEALGAGMPVIMPNISPNEWLPPEWLVPASRQGSFMAKQRIDYYSANHKAVAATIDRFATNTSFYTEAKEQAVKLADELSWDSLQGLYEQTFEELAA